MSQKLIEAAFQVRFTDSTQQGFSLDLKLSLPAKGITAVFGHSGSGKTTLLRCMAGLENDANFKMRVNDIVWQDEQLTLPCHKRNVAYVFQENGLLPHLTVLANLNYALARERNRALPSINDIAQQMGIDKLLSHMPQQLSGGERQRVAIARALLTQPDLLLMDEPLASLDTASKQAILPLIEELKQHQQVAIIYVSHDLNEVARLADHVVVLSQGKLVMQGETDDVIRQLSAKHELLDQASVVLEGEIIHREASWHLIHVKLHKAPQQVIWINDNNKPIGNDIRLRLLAKDVSITLEQHKDSSIVNRLPATISQIYPDYDQGMVLLELQLEQAFILAKLTRFSVAHLQLKVGSKVWAQIKSVAIVS